MNTPAEPSTPSEGTRQAEGTQAVHLMIDYATRYGFLLGGLEMVAKGHTTAEAVLARAREKYTEPPTLTDAEREAIEVAAEAYAADHGERFAAILRGLLERTMPARDETRPKPPANPERDVR